MRFNPELLEAINAFADEYLPSGLRDTPEWQKVIELASCDHEFRMPYKELGASCIHCEEPAPDSWYEHCE
jgi:hypothetical protein